MKLTVDWLFRRPEGGNETVFTVNATVTVTPGAILPKVTPVEGLPLDEVRHLLIHCQIRM